MTKDEEIYNDFQNKQELVKLEKKYIDLTIEDLQYDLQKKEIEIITQISAFRERFVEVDTKGREKWNIRGNKAFVIDNYFFKPLIPTIGVEPKYNAEKLGIVFQIYKLLIGRINADVGKFIPNKSHFCNFVGITTATYNKYMKSSDENLSQVANMIDDYLFNANISSAQLREVDPVSTIFRAKTEQQKSEEPVQQTVIVTDTVDINTIMSRVNRLNGIKDGKVIDDK